MPGLYFEDFSVGREFDHAIRRTVAEADNVIFAVANLGMDEVRFPKPVFRGDTLRIESEVLELRGSKSWRGQGIGVFVHRAINQKGEAVAHCKRTALMHERPR